MTTHDTRHTRGRGATHTENGSVTQHEDHHTRTRDMERMKEAVIRHVQSRLNEVLERALTDSIQSLSTHTHTHTDQTGSTNNRHKLEQGKVFIARCSLLDELFEISHIRTIYHMFIAALFLFIMSTLAVDYIDQGRLVLDFDLFYYAFGQLSTVVWAWTLMLSYTLLGPYHVLRVWGERAPRSRWRTCVCALTLCAAQTSMLGIFPVCVVLHYQLPPASRFIIILEQILASLFYLYFILVRLCIPVFRNNSNQPFSSRSLILMLFHAAFPGMLILMLGFYAFLHCWLNAFAEMLRFADRMFYKDWWNSTSFANYYRTWNIVVHDWLYYYGYRDFIRLSGHNLRSMATLCVFAVSALVHEYVFTMGFGFFYPVMFCTFAGIGVVFNFAMNDSRKSPVWNIIMWMCLFIGQGVHVCLYCLEWYAQIHCPRTGTSFWELVTPRSWTCNYQ
ncbi:hypothetical protein R3I94_011448 [Phoxinus phoxinus]